MRVDRHVGGSFCVVKFHREHYLDARKDVRQPHFSFIELVRNGQVYERHTVPNDIAPEVILQLMKGTIQ